MKNIGKNFNLFYCSIFVGCMLAGLFGFALLGMRYCYIAALAGVAVFAGMLVIPLYKRRKLLIAFQNNQLTLSEIAALMPDGELREFINSIIINYEKGYQADMLIRQAEIKYLQGQIKPHFLYNSLESIRGKAYIDGEMEIADMTEALAAYFRYSIGQKGRMVTLSEELSNIRYYFLIQQYRFRNKFAIEYIMEDQELNPEKYYIPKMTLQPVIENAIHHGLENKTEQGKIRIRIEMADNRIILNISDDGVGMDMESVRWLNNITANKIKPQTEKGMAIYNVDQRIKLYFGEEFGLYFSSTEGFGTNVEMVLPVVDELWAKSIEERVNEI